MKKTLEVSESLMQRFTAYQKKTKVSFKTVVAIALDDFLRNKGF